MTLLDLQRRWRELGRLRMGAKAVSRGGKEYPTKLSEWRITSANVDLLNVVAEVYGGKVDEWKGAPTAGKQYEVLTSTDRLDVLVPPGEPLTQAWELWSGGGCERRCNGRAMIPNGEPCLCPADLEERGELAKDGKACKATSRFSVILPRVPDIGVWRVESHGLNAAVELPGTVDILRRAFDEGVMIPAQLRIDQRTSRKDGETRQFVVPVLELPTVTVEALRSGGVQGVPAIGATAAQAALPAPTADGPGGGPEPPSAVEPPRAPASKPQAKATKAPAKKAAAPPLPGEADSNLAAQVADIAARIAALSKEDQASVRKGFEQARIPTDADHFEARHIRKANAVLSSYEHDKPATSAPTAAAGPDDPERPFTDDDATDPYERRKRWIMAEVAKVPALGEGDSDAKTGRRHALIRHATKGAQSSSARLEEDQARAVVALITQVATGAVEIAQRDNGDFEIRTPATEGAS